MVDAQSVGVEESTAPVDSPEVEASEVDGEDAAWGGIWENHSDIQFGSDADEDAELEASEEPAPLEAAKPREDTAEDEDESPLEALLRQEREGEDAESADEDEDELEAASDEQATEGKSKSRAQRRIEALAKEKQSFRDEAERYRLQVGEVYQQSQAQIQQYAEALNQTQQQLAKVQGQYEMLMNGRYVPLEQQEQDPQVQRMEELVAQHPEMTQLKQELAELKQFRQQEEQQRQEQAKRQEMDAYKQKFNGEADQALRTTVLKGLPDEAMQSLLGKKTVNGLSYENVFRTFFLSTAAAAGVTPAAVSRDLREVTLAVANEIAKHEAAKRKQTLKSSKEAPRVASRSQGGLSVPQGKFETPIEVIRGNGFQNRQAWIEAGTPTLDPGKRD